VRPLWCESVVARAWQAATHENAANTFGVVWHVAHVSPEWRPDVIGNAVWANWP
jgi:hypothetical protein